MKDFVKVASRSELKAGELKLVEAEDEKIVLAVLGNDVIAFDNICPHADCDLVYGEIDGKDEIECDCHGSRFNVRSGALLQGPATTDLRIFGVRIEGDDVLVGPK
jgi:3-phenylpropionate/trans-cinnamate dioxygenase ferredoxin subunit